MSSKSNTNLLKMTNTLLLKDDVGKSKPSHYDLPDQEHNYGKPNQPDPEGAKAVTMTWKQHTTTSQCVPDRNFKALNQMCVSQKLFTAKDMYEFRKYNDVRFPVQEGQKTQTILLPDTDFCYGKPNRPSTPIKQVVSHQFGDTSDKNHYQNLLFRQSIKVPLPRTQTKAHRLMSAANKDKLDQQKTQFSSKNSSFKLSKFKEVQSKTQTRFSANNSQVMQKSAVQQSTSTKTKQ